MDHAGEPMKRYLVTVDEHEHVCEFDDNVSEEEIEQTCEYTMATLFERINSEYSEMSETEYLAWTRGNKRRG